MSMQLNFLKSVVVVAALVFLTAACGGGSEAATDGVASVSDLDETVEDAAEVAAGVAASDESDSGSDTQTAEEAALAISGCMRDNGWDSFPDPVIGDNGAPNLRAAIAESGVDFSDPTFRDQIERCSEETGADNFGTGARGDVREQVQEQLLGYTQCLRDEGLDVGDLTPPGQDGAGAGQGAGRPQGGGGLEDRSDRIADGLGLDSGDPETAAALDTCEPVLEEAFAGLAGGPGA